MTQSETESRFRYPGNYYGDFTRLLGLIADGAGSRVVVRPEQSEARKLYANIGITQLRHHLYLALHRAEGGIVFSYRDFCFCIQDQPYSNLRPNVRQESAQTLCGYAWQVAARIQALFPNANVEVEAA